MKTKVLFTIGALAGGGAEKAIITILKSLDRNKFEIGLLLYRKTGVYLKDIPNDVKVYYFSLGDEFYKNKFQKKIAKKKSKFLKRFPKNFYKKNNLIDYDIEIAYLQDLIPSVKYSPIKCKVGFIHNDLSANNFNKIREKIIESTKTFEKIICVSNEAKEVFINLGGSREKSAVLYNPIDSEEIEKKSRNCKLLNNRFTFLAIGRLHNQKRFDRLIEAATIIKEKTKIPFQIKILGEGALKNQLIRLIKENNLQDNVFINGFIRNPYCELKQSNCYVLSSDYEGFSITTAEAMILQKPIVATKTTGPTELLQNGFLGLLVEKSAQELAIGMIQVLENQGLRNEFSTRLSNIDFPFKKEIVIPELESILIHLARTKR